MTAWPILRQPTPDETRMYDLQFIRLANNRPLTKFEQWELKRLEDEFDRKNAWRAQG